MTLKGYEAIEFAAANGMTLSKYEDPTEDAREGLTVDEARKVAAEDPSLIYLEMDLSGWGVIGEPKEGVIVGGRVDVTGYNEGDYWSGEGFLGPDIYGIVPIYTAADGTQFPVGAKAYPYAC